MRWRDRLAGALGYQPAGPAPTQKAFVSTDQGIMNNEWDLGWWQQGMQPLNLQGANETVEACVAALSQTAAMCPIYLNQERDTGEIVRQRGSKPERALLNPNPYETRTLFVNNCIRSLYFDGNAYVVAKRDGNGAVDQLHLVNPRATRGVVDPESGAIYYYATPRQNQTEIAFDSVEDRIFPARDMFHLRIHTDRDPLRGQTPITAAANAIAASSAMVGHQSRFFANMSRPSGVLGTDQKLDKLQMTELREAFNKQSHSIDSGGVPILGSGLKWQPMSLSSQDAQLVEAYGMTVAGISRAFRVPLPIINDLNGSTFNNSAALMSWFLASGLGFILESFELELGKLFRLPFENRFNFDTRALLRSDEKTRIETLGEGVIKGIYAPNEARAREGLPPAPAGDEPRVQQQVVPLTAWEREASQPAPVATETIEASIRKAISAHE